MIHQRGASPAVVVAGSTLYVLGSDINNTNIDFLKLKEQQAEHSIMTTLINSGGWGSAETNLDA